MDRILYEQLPEMFACVGEIFIEKKEQLCAMDALLGDGDLGLTMSKGFGELPSILKSEQANAGGDIGKLLMKTGMRLSSVVPSTMGFLMASGIMEAGKRLRGRTELDSTAMADLFAGFAEGIKKRGKCNMGQRTIYDAVFPAAEAAEAEAQKPGASVENVTEAALVAAGEGVEATKQMTPVYGKAAVHAAACIGVPDQGAYAGYYLISGLAQYCKNM